MNSKRALREQLLAQRRAMSGHEAASLGKKISERALEAVDWTKVKNLHTYMPMHHLREVDTLPLLQRIWQDFPHIKTATWQKIGKSYKAFWMDEKSIAEPVPHGFELDMIIVPLLGFNKDCYRIGFGGGFYDRFLATQPKARTIGLCYESGLCEFQPDSHDVPLQKIITESTVYSRRTS